MVSALIAGVSGTLIGLSAIPVCVAARADWYWVPIVWTGTTTIVWLVKVTDFFNNDKAIASIQKQERVAEAPPVVYNPPAAEIVIQDGKSQKRAKLQAPKSDHTGFWKYADALVRGTAEISIDGGKHLPGAKAYGYTPAEFDGREDAWRPTALTGGIIEDDPEKSRGYRLTKKGRRALAVVAERRLGEWG